MGKDFWVYGKWERDTRWDMGVIIFSFLGVCFCLGPENVVENERYFFWGFYVVLVKLSDVNLQPFSWCLENVVHAKT